MVFGYKYGSMFASVNFLYCNCCIDEVDLTICVKKQQQLYLYILIKDTIRQTLLALMRNYIVVLKNNIIVY